MKNKDKFLDEYVNKPCPQVVLLCMPFGPLLHPSPALGCLSSALIERNISVRSRYYALDFAALIGLKFYSSIENRALIELVGDWIFSKITFPDFQGDDETYLSLVEGILDRPSILRTRELAVSFIDKAAKEVISMQPKIVGCSSTFIQNCASLAILRRIRELSPSIVTMMGGANCEGEMGRELHRNFPWVDYVMSGEGDLLLPELCSKVLAGEKIGGKSGWSYDGLYSPADRDESGYHERTPTRAVVHDLSVLPFPFYDDYFHDLEQSGLKDAITPGVQMETSRGCWWGEKHACTFCGLNGMSMKYRAKSPDHVISEVNYLSKRYNNKLLMMTDNMLSLKHIDDLLPQFKDSGFTFFYEVSPMLNRAQMKVLSDAGVRWTQPGLENLHDMCLSVLGKGNKAYHNIRFLKYALEYGISASWNFLYNFPGGEDAWYDEITDLIPLITHLQPPTMNGIPVRFDRFSRYHKQPELYNLRLKPFPFYSFIYPLNDEKLSRMAYYFSDDENHTFGPPSQSVLWSLQKIYEWKHIFKTSAESPMLGMIRPEPGMLLIKDLRPCALAKHHELSGTEAEIYEACEPGVTLKELKEKASALSEGSLRRIIYKFMELRLMAKVGEHYISLAVKSPIRAHLHKNMRPGGHFAYLNSKYEKRPEELTISDVYGVNI